MATAKTLEPIEKGVSYPLELFQQKTGLGKGAMRSIRKKAEQRGIELVKYEGGRAFVRGDDWNRYLAGEAPEAE